MCFLPCSRALSRCGETRNKNGGKDAQAVPKNVADPRCGLGTEASSFIQGCAGKAAPQKKPKRGLWAGKVPPAPQHNQKGKLVSGPTRMAQMFQIGPSQKLPGISRRTVSGFSEVEVKRSSGNGPSIRASMYQGSNQKQLIYTWRTQFSRNFQLGQPMPSA